VRWETCMTRPRVPQVPASIRNSANSSAPSRSSPSQGRCFVGAALLAVASVAGTSAPALGGGAPPPTDCVNLCGASLPDPCVVGNVSVTPGSTINCGTRTVDVQGTVYVTDGVFVLRAGTIKVDSGGQIAAYSSATPPKGGFTLDAIGDVTISSSGKLQASSDSGGGEILI